MRRFILFVCLLSVALFASAEINDILGNWKTVDDKTGNSYSVVSIYRGTDGLYYGKIAKMLVGPADLVCDKCPGDDHNAPLVGLVFIRGMKYDAKNNQLVGGKLLDPESGNFYYGKIYPKNGKLVLRGSIDKFGLLGRNQTWIRE
jgi:uncharacterized protein (DUF2147 family)